MPKLAIHAPRIGCRRVSSPRRIVHARSFPNLLSRTRAKPSYSPKPSPVHARRFPQEHLQNSPNLRRSSSIAGPPVPTSSRRLCSRTPAPLLQTWAPAAAAAAAEGPPPWILSDLPPATTASSGGLRRCDPRRTLPPSTETSSVCNLPPPLTLLKLQNQVSIR